MTHDNYYLKYLNDLRSREEKRTTGISEAEIERLMREYEDRFIGNAPIASGVIKAVTTEDVWWQNLSFEKKKIIMEAVNEADNNANN